ncbi:Fis family transcriptional regulator [Pyrobaculum sp. 3827-6]|uniref:ATPase domain-containing protein n=1 Tax=Pyrobaculum sp. 3827-6 TaxID=2983604 RepID=UPI0021D86D3B|nr:ATPase domain-containing protein [Pyrobaculum sp. 3827-6]MCU7786321.1 Fis family transcriptional regulator [Pyrobaculum sp. 3827-6]
MPKKAEAPEECQQYRGPKREDVVRLCAELGGLRHLAVKNVVELAQMLELEDDLEKAEEVLASIRRAAGVGARVVPVSEAVKTYAAAEVLKTHVSEFDEKTPWGGLRFGYIYGLAGEYGAGKSMFAIQASVLAALAGKRVVYIDTEGALNLSLFERVAKRFGSDLTALSDRLHITQVIDPVDLKEVLLSLRAVDVVVVDSMVSHALRAQFRGRERLAARQQLLAYFLDILRRMAAVYGTLSILTDQVIDVPDFFSSKRPAGGNVLLHGVHALFLMRRPNKQKAEGVMIPLDVPGMAPTTEIRYEIRDDGLY